MKNQRKKPKKTAPKKKKTKKKERRFRLLRSVHTKYICLYRRTGFGTRPKPFQGGYSSNFNTARERCTSSSAPRTDNYLSLSSFTSVRSQCLRATNTRIRYLTSEIRYRRRPHIHIYIYICTYTYIEYIKFPYMGI